MKRTLLLVDDDKSVMCLLADLFDYMGFTVLQANDGTVAVKILEEVSDIHVVLTDVCMPQMTGVELLQWIKKHQVPVECLVMSGHTTEEEHCELHKLGITEIFTKPFKRLSQVIAAVVSAAAKRCQQPFLLVADDDTDFAKATRAVLERAGYAVACVKNVASLEWAIKNWNPELVLFDTLNRGNASVDVCRRFSDKVKFVSCSSLPIEAQKVNLDAGAVDAVRKPVAADRLLALVASHVRNN